MTHSEKRLYLIKELLSEQSQYRDIDIPYNTKEQKQLLKSLMNIRYPHFPQKKAADIAVQTTTNFLRTNTQIEKVVFNVFKQDDYDIYKEILHM